MTSKVQGDEKVRQAPPRAVKQHVLPLASIERFYNVKNNVEVDLFLKDKRFPTGGKDKNFVALRAWTQFAEDQTAVYETTFQSAVEEVLQSKCMTECHMKIFSRFYALIKARSEARYTEIPSGSMLTDVSPAPDRSKDQTLQDERDGFFFHSDDENMGRMVKDHAILLSVLATERRQDHWGMLISTGPEFLVSDDFSHSALIPVTPYVYLAWDAETRFLSESEVHAMNRTIRSSARNFCFARSLDACWKTDALRTSLAPHPGALGI